MPIIKEDPLKKYDSSSFTFKSVKGEVKDAMHFDWKRDKVDDAKKKAIYQAPTYDDFKQRVAGCTLKPIHRDEFNAPPKYVFNKNSAVREGLAPPASGETVDASGGYVKAAIAAKTKPQLRSQRVPKTGHEFERDFRRCADSSEMVALLRQLDGDACARLFSRDIDAEVLRKAMVALDEAPVPGAAREFLTALTGRCPVSSARAATFFDAEERELVARLLARDRASDPADDVTICSSLTVPPTLVAEAVARMPAAATTQETPVATAAAAAVAGPEVKNETGGTCEQMD